MNPDLKIESRQIPLGRPFFDEKEIEANRRIFDSSWVINGPEVRKFEAIFKNYIGVKNASAVISCTAGMHLALSAFHLKPAEEVLLPTFNFIAAGLSVLQAGARPAFVDIDQRTGTLDAADLKRRVTPRSKAILALHCVGFPCAINEILQVALANGLKVVEDAAHALGASYAGQRIGNHGDAVTFSFGPLKMICTGMGGMVTSGDASLIEKINQLRSYGMDKSMWDRREVASPWSYSVSELGHNFRMTDFQAALGIEQMKKLDLFISVRRQLAARYDKELKELGFFDFFEPPSEAEAVPLYYAVKLIDGKGPSCRDDLVRFLIERGVGASVHWDPPLHLHPLFQRLGYRHGDFPQTEKLSKQVLSLPLHPAMTDEDVDYVTGRIREFFESRR